MNKVYGVWTEDLMAWADPGDSSRVYTTRKNAQTALDEYLKLNTVPDWEEGGLAYVYEIEVIQ